MTRMPDERPPKFLPDWKPNNGKRPRNNWRSCILEDLTHFTSVNNIDIDAVHALTADRVQWRHMIRRKRDVKRVKVVKFMRLNIAGCRGSFLFKGVSLKLYLSH